MAIKVVHWGTGPTGRLGLRGIINHPDLELVGLYVHSPDKVGQDAAALCGVAANTGVAATDDAAALAAGGADCLAYFGPAAHDGAGVADVAPFLSAGTNVVTTSFAGLTHPPTAEAALRDPLEAAAVAGGASFFATGIEPGFASDLLPMALLSSCDEIRSIRIQEIADYSGYPAADTLRYAFGFGEAPDFGCFLADPAILTGAWRGVVDAIADLLQTPLDAIETDYERATLDRDLDTAMGRLPAGSTAGVRFEVRGVLDGQPLVILEHVNRMAGDVAPAWPHGTAGDTLTYRVEIVGSPTMRCELVFDPPESEGGLTATAMRAVNAIPAVCAAGPGLLGATDVPLVASRNLASRNLASRAIAASARPGARPSQ
ncbi:NAD(P)H-dependent amine dehydrogenase family protein [Frankia nepalensis]|uniref:Dihydrodipicolinate reductase n=1 Tax=Frankia nepalensis TaxID=1836974 RepID=A0A937RGJ3_9ACTN|nr:dihydrodipicolinate reductase [Frankia nepalensis]MBL7497391.1 dihydrodipicolinate reductase [Frankia nepalensis]MBL7512094.1 dihydrodipicolinate reductase [Frankia nepalensis]MBL7631806.1 dihydrodipicolinate reductase [Frankia nepalensis]